MEKLALEDNQIDEEKKTVFRNIFSRVADKDLDPDVLQRLKSSEKNTISNFV